MKVGGGWFKYYYLEAKHLIRRKGGFISELKSTFAVSPFNMAEKYEKNFSDAHKQLLLLLSCEIVGAGFLNS